MVPESSRGSLVTPLARLESNLAEIRGRIEAAGRRSLLAATSPPPVVVVTKVAPAGAFEILSALGHRDVGENRVQAAHRRRATAPPGLVWHGIGHLQRNKARAARRLFDVFHALDSRPLADLVARSADPAAPAWPVYLEVNAAGDPQKGGVRPEGAMDFLEHVVRLPALQVLGFMTMARQGAPEDEIRRTFRTLRQLRDLAVDRGIGSPPPAGLSMGMTDDFEIAVEEGATVLRIGRACFEGVWPAGSGDVGGFS